MTLEEVIGCAAGADETSPELLKAAEARTDSAFHALLLKVWSSGVVPAECVKESLCTVWPRVAVTNRIPGSCGFEHYSPYAKR